VLVRRRTTPTKEELVKYAILIYGNEDMEPGDDAITAEYMALSERDTTLGGAELDFPSTATTVRVRDGETLTTDGPFAETKDVLGGFYLIDVPNLDDAIEFAAAVPAARRGGCVEVRPLVTRVDSAERARSEAAGSAGGGSGIQH
jgi:hypothetical protein